MSYSQDKHQGQAQVAQVQTHHPSLSTSFAQNYWAYFHGFTQSKERSLSQLSKSYDIEYNQSNQSSSSIKLINHSSNYEILTCKLKISYFQLVLHIYNHRGFNKTHTLHNISDTKLGIYETCFRDKKIAIKCIPFLDSKFQIKFMRAVQQYSIMKIASILKIGPKVDKIFGFDIVMYDQCIEFAMQKCEKISKWTSQDELLLKKKIFQLHQIHIVHQDVKPPNIMFSPSINEYVFIDYGFSKVVAENIGEKTLTIFMGSFAFCSPEMTKCYYQTKSYVDLYYNDIFCLQKTVAVLQKSNGQLKQNKISECFNGYYDNPQQKKVLEQLIVIYIKSRLYFRQKNISQDLAFIIKHSEVFLAFIKTIPFCWRLQFFKWQNFMQKFTFKQRRVCLNVNRALKIGEESNQFLADESENSDRINKLINQISLNDGENIEKNIRQILFNPQYIKASKLQYYLVFINYVDIFMGANRMDRQQAAKIMIKQKNIGNFTQANPIQVCLKYLLQLFLKESLCQTRYISILLSNLIIYQTYSSEQLLAVYSAICNLTMDPIRHIQLLFQCFAAIEWIIERAITRYKFTNVVSNAQDIILKRIHKMAQTHGKQQPILMLVERLLSQGKCHSSAENFDQLSKQIQLFQNTIAYKLWLDLVCFVNVKLIELNRYYKDLVKLCSHLQTIHADLKKIYPQRIRVDYITMKLLKFACDSNISDIAQDYYQRIRRSFGDQNLISKYKFHYSILYNKYFYQRLSNSQIIKQFLKHSEQQQFIHDEQILMKYSILAVHIRFYQYYNNNLVQLNRIIVAFRLQKLKQIKKPTFRKCQQSEYTIAKYYRIHFLYFKSIQFVQRYYKIQEKRSVIQKLKSTLKEVVCPQCLKECQKYTNLAQAIVQYDQSQPKKSIQIYMNIFRQIISRGTVKRNESSLIEYIAFRAVTIADQGVDHDTITKDYAYHIWQEIAVTLQKNQLLWIILAPHFSQQMFNYLCIHYFIIEKVDTRFFCLYLKIVQFLTFFHSSPLLKRINYITLKLFEICPQQLQQFNDGVLSTILAIIPKMHIAFRYISLLFSASLRFQKRNLIRFNKILRFICEDIALVNYEAKTIILGNIYYYKLWVFCLQSQKNEEQNIQFQRQKTKIFKSYIKYDVFQINFKKFSSSFLTKTLNNRNIIQSKFNKKIKAYYNNIKRQNQRTINELGDMYIYEPPL